MIAADAAAVARLHAASWRLAYADDLTPDFLSGPVDAERAAAWTARWKEAGATPAFGWVMEDASGLLGFVWVIPDADAVHGHLIDNLHVAPDRHGQGIGRRLLRAIAADLDAGHRKAGAYLWVYANNTRARQFYARCGADVLETAQQTTVEGHPVAAYRMGWPSASALLVGVG